MVRDRSVLSPQADAEGFTLTGAQQLGRPGRIIEVRGVPHAATSVPTEAPFAQRACDQWVHTVFSASYRPSNGQPPELGHSRESRGVREANVRARVRGSGRGSSSAAALRPRSAAASRPRMVAAASRPRTSAAASTCGRVCGLCGSSACGYVSRAQVCGGCDEGVMRGTSSLRSGAVAGRETLRE
jgi:hypothetical protein